MLAGPPRCVPGCLPPYGTAETVKSIAGRRTVPFTCAMPYPFTSPAIRTARRSQTSRRVVTINPMTVRIALPQVTVPVRSLRPRPDDSVVTSSSSLPTVQRSPTRRSLYSASFALFRKFGGHVGYAAYEQSALGRWPRGGWRGLDGPPPGAG